MTATGPGSYSATGLSTDTNYFYRFYATNSVASVWAGGPAEEFSTPFESIHSPSALSAVNPDSSSNTIELSWTVNSASHYGFVIERSTNGIDFAHLIEDIGGGANNSFTDATCAPETTYYYRVAAINHYGTTGWSNTATAATQPVPPAPTVTNLGATGAGVREATVRGSVQGLANGTLYLCWEPHDETPESSLSDWTNIVDMSVDTDDATMAHLLHHLPNTVTTYDFAWYAVNPGGATWSATDSFTTTEKVYTLLDYANPFFGNDGTDLPAPQGVAAAWNWEKAQNGNTHPGPQLPFGMVSLTPYSAGYSSGYGANEKTFFGAPRVIQSRLDSAYGFTHFQQSGTGDMGTFYNLLRVFPLSGSGYSAETRKNLFKMQEMEARPGYFGAILEHNDAYVQLTSSDKVAFHRYIFPPAAENTQIGIEINAAGLGDTPSKVLKVDVDKLSENRIGGKLTAADFPYYFVMEVSGTATGGGFHGQDGVDYNSDGTIRRTYPVDVSETAANLNINKLRSGYDKDNGVEIYIDYFFNVESTVEVKIAFSFRSLAQALQNLQDAPADFDAALAEAETTWLNHLQRIPYQPENEERKELFYSNLYHTLTKPSICDNESPWWTDEVFVTDFSTIWDVYKSQLPLVFKYYPEHGEKIVKGIVNAMDEMAEVDSHGFFPVGFYKAENFNKFNGQTTGIEWPVLAYAHDIFPQMDPQVWSRALSHAGGFANSDRVQEILTNGKAADQPYSHTIDVASAFSSICDLARKTGNDDVFNTHSNHRDSWINAYDNATGLLKDGDYYEGTKWNYSFRPHYGMDARVAMAGGPEAFAELLDEFFGYKDIADGTMDPNPTEETFQRLIRDDRFEGLNNECDMEAPFAYLWSSKPERTQEIIDAVMEHQFGTGRNGLPGNNDSGATSSWYVLNAIGDFPLIEYFAETEPEINVEQPAGIPLVDGSSSVAFDTAPRVFTISNTGTADLKLFGVTKSGTNASDFTIDTSGMSTVVAPNASTTFTVTFAPGAIGSRIAALRIASDDRNENYFNITLTGAGQLSYHDAATAAGLTGDSALPEATPFNDGVTNLYKYAFNFDLGVAGWHRMEEGGDSGLPRFSYIRDQDPDVWRVEFVRRIGNELNYTPMKSEDMSEGSWTTFSSTPTVTAIDSQWERVVYDEPAVTQRLFTRVDVTIQ